MGRTLIVRSFAPKIERTQLLALLSFEMIGKIDPSPVANSFSQDLAVKNPAGGEPNLSVTPAKSLGPKDLTGADYRLVIEKSSETGTYVYKTLNSFTGEVVSQRPAEDLLQIGASAQYAPGSIVSSKA